jgi:hypothetical protein
MNKAAKSGPAAKPNFKGTGKDGMKKGMEPMITPKINPPKRERKSGSNSIFLEFPTIFSTSAIACLFPNF